MLVPVTSFFEDKPAVDRVPSTPSHCMIAVRKKGHDTRASWNICRASLVKSKHLKGPYRRDAKLGQSVKQTQKGTRRTMKHSSEKAAPGKYKKFKDMFRKIEPGVTRDR